MGKKQKASKKPNKGAPASTAAGGDSKAERQKGGKQRRRGKEHQWETCELEKELATVGLRIKSIEPDGNCFFRAVLDQLEGEGGDHVGLRRRVMDHIEEQQEHYSLFIEDDEPFERYVKRMRKEGVWAGNMELVAASTLLQHSINIYQAGQPVWQISCAPDAPVLHLSYHDGMHYNSVRSAGDYGSGPPEPLRLGSIAAADPAAVAEAARSFGAAEVDRVVAGTGCGDRNRAAAVLERCGGDVDVAIEVLIEEMGKEGEQEAANGEADGCNGAAGDQRQQQEHQQHQQQQHEGLEPAPELQPGPQRQHAEGTGTHDRMAAGSEQQQQASAVQGSSTECVHLVQLELLPCRCDPERITAVLHTRPPDYQGQQGKQQLEEEQQEHEQEEQVAEPPRNKRGGGKKGGVKVKEAKIVAAGRNRRCPCGSTKKYKNCCGAVPKPAPAAVDAGEAARQLQFLHI